MEGFYRKKGGARELSTTTKSNKKGLFLFIYFHKTRTHYLKMRRKARGRETVLLDELI